MSLILKKMIYISTSIIFVAILFLLWLDLKNFYMIIIPIILSIIIPILLNKVRNIHLKNHENDKEVGILKLYKKYKEKIFILLILIFAFIIRLSVLLILDIEPCSDFALLLNAATNLSEGINVMEESTYFQTWAYQTGFVLYQTIILKIFNSAFVLHILDCLFTSVICVFIYIIGKQIFEKSNKLPAIMYALYVYAIAYAGVLTNQHIFTFISLIAIILTLKDTKIDKLKYLIIGILLGIANILRPEGIVILMSIILYKIFNLESKKEIKNIIIRILILCVTYITVVQMASIAVKLSNVNKYGLTNNNPLWKFVCGSDYETGGGYSFKGEQIMGDEAKEIEFITQNYKSLNLRRGISLIKRKIENFWLSDAYSWVFLELYNNGQEESYEKYVRYDQMLYNFILINAIYSMINGIKDYKKNDKKLILIFILLINFAVYLLIEVQPRYSYTAKIILFILACDGIEQMAKFAGNLLDGRRNKIDKRKSIKI